MNMKQQTKTIARVYNRDGKHVADLHSPELYHEFAEFEEWDVELIDETALEMTENISNQD